MHSGCRSRETFCSRNTLFVQRKKGGSMRVKEQVELVKSAAPAPQPPSSTWPSHCLTRQRTTPHNTDVPPWTKPHAATRTWNSRLVVVRCTWEKPDPNCQRLHPHQSTGLAAALQHGMSTRSLSHEIFSSTTAGCRRWIMGKLSAQIAHPPKLIGNAELLVAVRTYCPGGIPTDH